MLTTFIKEKKGIIILSSVAFVGLVSGGIATKFFLLHSSQNISPHLNAQSITPTLTPTPSPDVAYNFLNGTQMTKEQYTSLSLHRPIAVMIPNDPSARPQLGLNKADVVYEALTEGPITRFMGIFWSNQQDYKIMPIRSIRVYFLQWLLEYNDIIVMHTGYAQTNNPETNALAILQNYHVKTLIWDFPATYDTPCQATRPVWNCAYSDSQRLWNVAETKHQWTGSNWGGLTPALQWIFKDEAKLQSRGTATTIKIPFLYANDYSTTFWVYNPVNNVYNREDNYQKPFMDALDNTQVYTKTLIVQKVPYKQTYDEKDRSIQEVSGQGQAYVFEDGKQIQATWKKTSITDRTRFYDSNGNEIQFNRGKIWISVIPDTQNITVQ